MVNEKELVSNNARKVLLRLTHLYVKYKKGKNLVDGTTAPLAFSTISEGDWREARRLWDSFGRKLLGEQTTRACPACGNSDSHIVFETYDGYLFKECHECQCWYSEKNVDWDFFEKFYEVCPEALELSNKILKNRVDLTRKEDFKRFERYFKRLYKIYEVDSALNNYLDIGSGIGVSLEVATKLGFNSHGLEKDLGAVAISRVNCKNVYTDINELPSIKYDLITAWETIEHLNNPKKMLLELKDKLNAGGVIAFTIPNLNSLSIQIMREKCTDIYGGYNSPGHINLFNAENLKIMLAQADLSIIDLSYDYTPNIIQLFGYLSKMQAYKNPFEVAYPNDYWTEFLNWVSGDSYLLLNCLGLDPIIFCCVCKKEDEHLFIKKKEILKQFNISEYEQKIRQMEEEHLINLNSYK